MYFILLLTMNSFKKIKLKSQIKPEKCRIVAAAHLSALALALVTFPVCSVYTPFSQIKLSRRSFNIIPDSDRVIKPDKPRKQARFTVKKREIKQEVHSPQFHVGFCCCE